MKKIIGALALLAITVSAYFVIYDPVDELVTMINDSHYFEMDCSRSDKDLICVAEKKSWAQTADYNHDITVFNQEREYFINKEFKERGIHGEVKIKFK